ncbi:uncharacterized protein LOC110115909 [Dendrobium catenatum]|uniref:uncharacterized protein LOC110115909 n=1 Tax=Dendrobium catenatum TaxID=906689 RepID=UPI00109F9BB9|nr:uncharacterized protein LOC110115909 [Dendrobium catenatum]
MAAWNIRGFNSPDKVLCCKNLAQKHNIDILFILESKTSLSSLSSHWFQANHRIFPLENSCHNFHLANPGRIWIKWNANSVNFIPKITTNQLIHGTITVASKTVCAITFVYASNSHTERQLLWDDIQNISSTIATPWAIIGDFNCCRYHNEKAGGIQLNNTKLGEFNKVIFNSGLHDLSSSGHFFTWHNQQPGNPIHIKLDRVLINDAWLNVFPNSYYIVGDPNCSDHSPLILSNNLIVKKGHSPLFSFYNKLKSLKNLIKNKNWTNSSAIQREIDSLTDLQNQVLTNLQGNPIDPTLNAALNSINAKLSYYHSTLTSWMSQRAKINITSNYNRIKEIDTDSGSVSSHKDISTAFINHFSKFFNTHHTRSPNFTSHNIPAGATIPPHLLPLLTAPVTMEEIKAIIFSGKANSTSGPDGFPFEFYKSSWNIIKHHLCKAILSFFSTGFMPNQVKATAIALIPKHPHASTTSTNAHTLIDILDNFASVAGLHVNAHKSSILISKGALQAEQICDILHIQQSFNPLKYLGLPIFYSKLKALDFQPLILNISSSLEGWKAKTLSFAGRIQFLNFTICNTLAYWIRGSIIPKCCCKTINRLCSRFLYFGDTSLKILQTISWKNTCLPKQFGGLGIPSIDSLQHNFACSIIWRFLNSNNPLFDWWRASYSSLWNVWNGKGSTYWNFICTKANTVKQCLNLFVHQSSNLSFLWDPWCNGKSIADLLITNYELKEFSFMSNWKISNVICDMSWNLPRCLDASTISAISCIPIYEAVESFNQELDKDSTKPLLRISMD